MSITADAIDTALEALPTEKLNGMLLAGAQIKNCYRLLMKNEQYGNVVREVLKEQGQFVEYDHYPSGDVHDRDTHCQYFYHAHRGLNGENGHFHTFVRYKGMPNGVTPIEYNGDTEWPAGEDALSHLVAISMDSRGYPIGMFSTNRWVTGETFYKATDVISMLDRFEMDLLYPSWPVNIWITSTMRLFRPQVEALLLQRDVTIDQWRSSHPDKDVYEDRDLEVTSEVLIDVEAQIQAVTAALRKRNALH
ncbi:MAG: hypothetical protein AAF404_06250 [Pseudomonadota bacterium]